MARESLNGLWHSSLRCCGLVIDLLTLIAHMRRATLSRYSSYLPWHPLTGSPCTTRTCMYICIEPLRVRESVLWDAYLLFLQAIILKVEDEGRITCRIAFLRRKVSLAEYDVPCAQHVLMGGNPIALLCPATKRSRGTVELVDYSPT